jgi:peptidoglycan/xylan/chitin deacetylase (PgdA/CDA1 family)
MKKTFITCFAAGMLFIACKSTDPKSTTPETKDSTAVAPKSTTATGNAPVSTSGPLADAQTILARRQVPILCYHHIKNNPGGKLTDYSVAPETFAAEMKILADSGYKTILPDQLYNYLERGTPIPAKSVMITFDDTDLEQFTIGKSEMDKYGFKGVYYIMTISLNRPRYMTNDNLKQLVAEGHVVGCHTWDHHMVTKYTDDDWDKQLVKPKQKLEGIIGKQIDYFAYPFGLWNTAAIPHLKQNGIKMAFILSTARDTTDPIYTVRRMIVAGQWTAKGMMSAMKGTFHL